MVDEPQSSDETQTGSDRRAREETRRATRQRHMNIVGTILTVAIVVLVVLVTTDTLRVSGRGPTLASGKTITTTTTALANPTADVKNLKRQRPSRPLSNAAPLRLWVGGDSLSGELGFQLGPIVSKLGIVRAHVDYKVSSGLASNSVRDWPENFSEEEVQYQPEAVIFMIGANDAPIVGSALDASGAPAWETKYRTQVDHMMDLLVGGNLNRTVFWIGTPPLENGSYRRGAPEIDRVMREEAAKRPTVVYIDAFSMFAENGEYSSSLPDGQGNRVQMRSGDGVHFTVKGADYLAEHVFALIDSRWNLTTQAAPDTPIEYTIEPSNSNVGGVHIGNGGGGPASTTTVPATVASTTTVPATPPPTSAPTTSTPPTSAPPTSPPTT